MSTDFQPIEYKVDDVGKLMKASKKRHMWMFRFKSKRFTLCVFESLKSGKFKIELNKRKIYETVGGKRSISKKVHDSKVGALTIELMKITNNQYRLTLNKNTFETKQSHQRLFVYETFEEKQKKMQQQGSKKVDEDFFAIGKGKAGLKGSDLFGDFKSKTQKTEKLKLKFGGKGQQKKDLFRFDKGVFGKKSKFDQKDYFGSKNKAQPKAKKDPFAKGSDLFASKKKKPASDFDGFDLFGNNSKPKRAPAKSNDAFADFGFGSKKPKPKAAGWGDADIFGQKSPGKANPPKRSAKNEIFGAPQKPAQDEDLLNFDIGQPTPSQKPQKSKGFGDLDWDMPVKPSKQPKKVRG